MSARRWFATPAAAAVATLIAVVGCKDSQEAVGKGDAPVLVTLNTAQRALLDPTWIGGVTEVRCGGTPAGTAYQLTTRTLRRPDGSVVILSEFSHVRTGRLHVTLRHIKDGETTAIRNVLQRPSLSLADADALDSLTARILRLPCTA